MVRVNSINKQRLVFECPWAYILFLWNMVRGSVIGTLRMRKQNAKITVPLDAVPELRTKRCSPRFRPGGRFCELRFRYQSSPTGREGEISRPLDHTWQTPFIHLTPFMISSIFDIYITTFQLFPPYGTSYCMFKWHIAWQLRMHSAETIISRFRAIIQVMLYSIR